MTVIIGTTRTTYTVEYQLAVIQGGRGEIERAPMGEFGKERLLWKYSGGVTRFVGFPTTG